LVFLSLSVCSFQLIQDEVRGKGIEAPEFSFEAEDNEDADDSEGEDDGDGSSSGDEEDSSNHDESSLKVDITD
jgi:hypothetical protein